jgi:type IV secretion system protein VirB9
MLCVAGCATQQPPPPPVIQAPKPQVYVPPDPYAGLPSDVIDAIKHNETPTLQNGITTTWPYSPDEQWEVDCAPLRATELHLSPTEVTDKDSVVLGDSVRWAVRIGMHSVMVEPLGTPADPQMATNLIISTNERSYHLMLRLRPHHYMPAVAWYYGDQVRATEAQREYALKLAAAQNDQAADPPSQPQRGNNQ